MGLFKRLVIAAETIAGELVAIREEQKYYLELSRAESEKAPQKLFESFARIQKLANKKGSEGEIVDELRKLVQ